MKLRTLPRALRLALKALHLATTATSYHGSGADTGIATAIVAAVDKAGLYTLKIVRGSGTDSGDGPAPVAGDVVQYAQGYLHTYAENAKDVNTNEGGTISFMQNAFTVDDVEPS